MFPGVVYRAREKSEEYQHFSKVICPHCQQLIIVSGWGYNGRQRPLTFFVHSPVISFLLSFLGNMLFWGRKGFIPGKDRIPGPSLSPLIFFLFTYMSWNVVERLCVKNLRIDCWCGHLRPYWECVLGTHPCPPLPVL